MRDCARALLFVGLWIVLSRRCIGKLFTITCLLSDILGVVRKRQL